MAHSEDQMLSTGTELHDALRMMESALALLDEADDAFDVAAHLDLAIERLRDKVASQASAFGASGFAAANTLAA
jgi:hypothetical protein